MPRNFDAERSQRPMEEFTIGGEVFHVKRSIRPEALVAYEEMPDGVGGTQALGIIDSVIVECLADEDGAERWARVRQLTGDLEVGMADLQDLIEWLMEVILGRPTAPAVSFSAGPPVTDGTPSTDASSSPAALALAR